VTMQMFREPVEGNTKPNTQLVEIRFKTNTDSNVKSLCAGYGTPVRLAMVTKEWEVEIDPGDADNSRVLEVEKAVPFFAAKR
jgi:hypothetical protein